VHEETAEVVKRIKEVIDHHREFTDPRYACSNYTSHIIRDLENLLLTLE
jgi:hypothetical protein